VPTALGLSAMLRVAIVDDDVWMRRGRETALNDLPQFTAVGLRPEQALDGDSLVSFDVVILDAHDPGQQLDGFFGVRVAHHLRTAPGGHRPAILVISGHAENEILRLRMLEAGADFFHSHLDFPSVSDLAQAVVYAAERVSEAGYQRQVHPPVINSALAWADDHLPNEALSGESQKSLPVSRRTIISARQRFAAAVTGDARNVPTWKSVTEFLDKARGNPLDRSRVRRS
jgi:CheY-like chemotaxis protein